MAALNRRDLLKAGVVTAAFGTAAISGKAVANPVSYPDAIGVEKPSPEPELPRRFDRFEPPVDSAAPVSGAPQIAEWSRTAGADESMVLTGENFTSTMSFMVFGRGRRRFSAAVQKVNGQKAILTLPSALPSWATYLVWAQNEHGAGCAKLVNKTTAYWLGPDKAEVGGTVGVHGINLAHNNGTADSWIYLLPTGGGAGQWLTPVNVNPYRVQFVVPELPIGTYQVWIHNGHGGHYGWSRTPTDLAVYSGPQWTSTRYNVADYGAIGDGVADDTVAIKAAIDAVPANSKATLFFPAGTYVVSSQLDMKSGTRWAGAGIESSVIKPVGGYRTQIKASGLDAIEIADLTLDMSTMTEDVSFTNNHGINPAASTNVWFSRIKVIAPIHGSPLGGVWFNDTIIDCSYVYLKNCIFYTSNSGGVSNSRQIFVDGCAFFGQDHLGREGSPFPYGASGAFSSHAIREFSLTNCTAADANPGVARGTLRRFMTHGNGPRNGGFLNEYIADNTTVDLGPIPKTATDPGSTDPNSGEIFLWECGGELFSITDATATTVTVSGTPSTGINTTIYISEGKGLGQVRVITALSASTVTVDAPWDVIPDTTSRAHILHGPIRTIVYNNRLDGKRDKYPTLNTNASGINFYGGGFQAVFANNSITNVQYGVGLWSQAGITGDNPPRLKGDSWNMVVNNLVSDSRDGVIILNSHQGARGTAATPHANSLGNIVRRNTITNCTQALATDNHELIRDDESRNLQESVLEKNQANDVNVGINLGVTQADVSTNFLIYKNVMDAGAMSAGSVAIDFDDSPQQGAVLADNTWTNFETQYGGAVQT